MINEVIKQSILNEYPKSFGKLGNVEAKHLVSYLQNKPTLYGNELFFNAGIYIRNINDFNEWCNLLLESIKDLDYILQWCPNKEDQTVIDYCNKENVFYSFEGLEPFVFGNDGWHYSLDNKNILCVSPFSETIKNQFKNFDKIWPNANIGNILTITSPYSEALTGEQPVPWKDKLNKMLDQITQTDFDFATVGCGGFSLIVCSHIKKMGKPCVHLGGGNQILYGIRGRRWDDCFKQYEWYGTKYWVRPNDEEIPKNSFLLENGCYW